MQKKKTFSRIVCNFIKDQIKKKPCKIIEVNIACMYQQPCHTGGGLQFQIYHLTWKKNLAKSVLITGYVKAVVKVKRYVL